MKQGRRFLDMVFGLCFLGGCMGTFNYIGPSESGRAMGPRTVEKSKDDVWRQIVPVVERNTFTVDRLDKDAGVITLRYEGDPEPYVDCGWIESYVKNLRGERTYRFAAASASTEYELVTGKEILLIDRQMALQGRLTVTVTAIGARKTQVSAHAHYTLTRTLMVRDIEGHARTISHLTDFSSGKDGIFPGQVTCRANGQLEKDVLSVLGY